MPDLTLDAPAKINVSLKVLGKRADGFHELETVMVPVASLADTLHFTAAETFSFHCDAPGVPTDESNLVVKAVRAYEAAAEVCVAYDISLEKRIPHGAGLGGGSSDAAFTLLGLNRLYGDPLSLARLHELAETLGSDVPFFLYESPCICKGRGEIIEQIPQAETFPMVLLKPSFAVSTPDAFKRWQTAVELDGFTYAAQDGPYGKMWNELEQPVFQKYLFLGELKSWLLAQPEVSVAQMSGSGSTMIALLNKMEDADVLISKAQDTWDPHLFSWAGMV